MESWHRPSHTRTLDQSECFAVVVGLVLEERRREMFTDYGYENSNLKYSVFY